MYSSDASMAATVDSGNETLFSDDSSCDLVMSPSACEADVSRSDDNTDIQPPRVAPPKIQPYSGVLEKVSHLSVTHSLTHHLVYTLYTHIFI